LLGGFDFNLGILKRHRPLFPSHFGYLYSIALSPDSELHRARGTNSFDEPDLSLQPRVQSVLDAWKEEGEGQSLQPMPKCVDIKRWRLWKVMRVGPHRGDYCPFKTGLKELL
jgi:hypothetical protein